MTCFTVTFVTRLQTKKIYFQNVPSGLSWPSGQCMHLSFCQLSVWIKDQNRPILGAKARNALFERRWMINFHQSVSTGFDLKRNGHTRFNSQLPVYSVRKHVVSAQHSVFTSKLLTSHPVREYMMKTNTTCYHLPLSRSLICSSGGRCWTSIHHLMMMM